MSDAPDRPGQNEAIVPEGARIDAPEPATVTLGGIHVVALRATDRPNVVAGRYEVGELLGAGGMGRVFRARDRVLQRDLALKLITSDGSVPAERLLREARAQGRVDHENVCRVFDAGESDGHAYVADAARHRHDRSRRAAASLTLRRAPRGRRAGRRGGARRAPLRPRPPRPQARQHHAGAARGRPLESGGRRLRPGARPRRRSEHRAGRSPGRRSTWPLSRSAAPSSAPTGAPTCGRSASTLYELAIGPAAVRHRARGSRCWCTCSRTSYASRAPLASRPTCARSSAAASRRSQSGATAAPASSPRTSSATSTACRSRRDRRACWSGSARRRAATRA